MCIYLYLKNVHVIDASALLAYSRVASSKTLHFGNPELFLLFWYAEIVYFKNPFGAICGRLSILHNLTKSKMAASYY